MLAGEVALARGDLPGAAELAAAIAHQAGLAAEDS
jgi:hypothetical protein